MVYIYQQPACYRSKEYRYGLSKKIKEPRDTQRTYYMAADLDRSPLAGIISFYERALQQDRD